MRIFVAGATGVLGRQAVRAFVAAGHDVTGVARGGDKAELVRKMGAGPVAVDLFDAQALRRVVAGHDVVCNFATHIPASATGYFRRSAWAMNDRLHREVSRNLVAVGNEIGVQRYLQHSVSFMYADAGDRWIDEDAPLDVPPHGQAVVEAEQQALSLKGAGIALRFGLFYGPDAPSGRDLLRIARMGFVPMTGDAGAYSPFIYTDDLGTSVVAALRAPPGSYNVTDDEPLTRTDLGEVLGDALGKKRRRLPPRVVMRAMPKRFDYLSRSQRVSNGRFKEATGWSPSVPSGRDGWKRMV